MEAPWGMPNYCSGLQNIMRRVPCVTCRQVDFSWPTRGADISMPCASVSRVSAAFSFAWLSFARLSLVPVEGVLPEEADEAIAFICSNCLFVATNFVAKFHGADAGANGYREGFACTFFSSVTARNSFSSSLM